MARIVSIKLHRMRKVFQNSVTLEQVKYVRRMLKARQKYLIWKRVTVIVGILSFVTTICLAAQNDLSVKGFTDIIKDEGVIGLLVMNLFLVTIGSMRGWFYWRREYMALLREKDEWKAATLAGTRIAEQSFAFTKQ